MRIAVAAIGLLALIAVAVVAMWPGAQDVAKEERFVLPSGLEAYLQEVLNEQGGDGLLYRFRFVAPDFETSEAFDAQSADLEALCEDHAAPQLANISPAPNKIVISLADQPSQFGVFDPNVAQIFESFSFQNGACIWEMF